MEYCLFNKVRVKTGKYSNAVGEIVMIHPNDEWKEEVNSEPMYTVKYDIPFGSCTKGMFEESNLERVN